jgi:hypothetical protein
MAQALMHRNPQVAAGRRQAGFGFRPLPHSVGASSTAVRGGGCRNAGRARGDPMAILSRPPRHYYTEIPRSKQEAGWF